MAKDICDQGTGLRQGPHTTARRTRLATSAALGWMVVVACAGTHSQEPQESTKAQSAPIAVERVVAPALAQPLPTSISQSATSRGFGAFASPAIRQAAMRYPVAQKTSVEAPISLTAADGTGQILESLDARAVIEGPLAFTELRMQFRNPQNRVVEGRFQVTLPAGASVSRLAMKTSNGWQEAEMVDRQAARRAYEDFLHRKQDPMLLEKEAGNQFRARIFPIPANGIKEVIVSYSHELSANGNYRLPLRGLPQINDIRVKALVAEPDGQRTRYAPHQMHVAATVPTADFELAAQSQLPALRYGSHVVARVQPTISVPTQPLSGVTILFDTSASRAPGFARQVQRLGVLVQQLAIAQGERLPVQIAAFDQSVAPLFSGGAGEFGQEQLATLLARRPLGASDVGAALRWAGENASLGRVLIITDAITTAGDEELGAVARALPAAVERIDVLLVGGIRDDDAAAAVVRGTRANDGVILQDAMSNTEIVRRMGDATTSLQVQVAGASWTWPSTLHGIQPGDDFILYSAFPESKDAPAALDVQINGRETIALQSATAPGPLLTRSIVQAKIRRLQIDHAGAETAAEKSDLRQAIVALSTTHRVLSDFTALLVLESNGDYRRFGIDRKALADIMTIEDSGVTVRKRTAVVTANKPVPKVRVRRSARDQARATGQYAMRNSRSAPQVPPPVVEEFAEDQAYGNLMGNVVAESVGAKALGISGVGNGGGGTGWGAIGSGHYGTIGHGSGTGHGYGTIGIGRGRRGTRASVPRVRIGTARVAGSLDKALIRRYVRRNLPRFRHCYERELVSHPSLRGTVTTQFLIAPTGLVLAANATGLGNTRVETCMVTALRTIRFPKHQGAGPVQVRYPFTLEPAEAASDQPTAWSPGQPRPEPRQRQRQRQRNRVQRIADKKSPAALTGKMATIHDAIAAGHIDDAVEQALAWRNEESGNVMALVALGEGLQAAGKTQLAARAFGSIIDLFPSRADLRRFAATRLVDLQADGSELGVDSLRQAAEQRPDHLSVHRLLAYALVRAGELEAAFAALETGLSQRYPGGRFEGGTRILREDLGIVASAWLAKDESKRAGILERLHKARARLATRPSTRFVLNWETDANDVDFHIYDARGGHAYYSDRRLSSGGELFADVTTGYGPECFAINGKAKAYPYDLQIHYYSRGPMGYGMGQVEVLQHDGKGGLKFETRPFVVMNDSAYLALGRIEKPL